MDITYGPLSITGMDASYAFTPMATASDVPTSGSATLTTYRDAVVSSGNSGVLTRQFALSITSGTKAGPITTRVASGPLTLSGQVATSTGSGQATIEVSGAWGAKTLSVQASVGQVGAFVNFAGFAPGSLGDWLRTRIAGYYAGITDARTRAPLWAALQLSADSAALSATPNPTRLAPELDLSWLAVARVNGTVASETFTAALISTRHVICANHVGLGDAVLFRRASDGVILKGTIISGMTLSNATGGLTDARIGYLDQPMTGCTVVGFAPSLDNLAYWLPRSWSGILPAYSLPAMAITVNAAPNTPPGYYPGRHLIPVDVKATGVPLAYEGGTYSPEIQLSSPLDPAVAGFYSLPYSGDSSSTVFLPVPDGASVKCALLTSLHGAESGPDYAALITQINAAMNVLAGTSNTYVAQVADMSSFATY